MSLGKRLIQQAASSGPGTEEVVDIFSDSSCKALYTFNHDASDRSGNYSLTEYNSSNNLWGAGGKFNTGYRIKESSNGYLGITNHGFNYTDTAVSFWFYADKALGEADSTARTIFTFQNGTSTQKAYIGVSYSSGSWYGYINARSGLYGSTSTTVAFSGVIGGSELDNTWVHIVGQTGSTLVDSRRNSFYVNGSLWTGMTYTTGNSTSTGGFSSPNPQRFYVGYYYSGAIQYAPKYPIDQLRIFNKKLTASEASTLYNESVGTVQSTTDVVYFPTSALDTNLETQEVARYLLNDDVTDDLGNYNGTATSITYTTGKYGKSAVFNGTSSKITTGYTDNPSAFSVSGWIKHTSSTFTGKYHYLAGKGYYTNSSTNNYWQLVNYSSSYPEFRVRSGGTSVAATSSVAMTLDYWHHLVGTCDSAGNLKIYLDGTLVGSASGAPSRSMSQGMIIGSYLDGTTYFHEGEIDQVRVFDYALGQEAVNSLYSDSDTPVIIDKVPETAFYKLNDNAYDSAGGFDGTASSITYTNGLFGKAASFDGYNSAIDVNNVSALNNLTAISLSFWFKWDDATSVSSYEHMLNIGDASGNAAGDYFGIAIGDDGSGYNKELYTYCPSPDASLNTNQTVTANAWHHVVLTYSGTSIKVYYDGNTTPIQTRTVTSLSLPSSGNGIFIGHYKYNGSHHFRGSLDQIRVFDQAISSNQVSDLYNEASSAFSLSTLQAYYKLDNSAVDEASELNGTETNVEYRFGRYGQAAVFNGSSSKIVLPSGDLGINSNNVSLSIWFKSTDITQDNQSLFWIQHPSSNVRVGAIVSSPSYGADSDIRFTCYTNTNGTLENAYTNSNILATNAWYHAVFVKSSTNGMTVYINGSSVATNTAATGDLGNNTSSGATNSVGYYRTSSDSLYFNGQLDQFRIYNSVLSQDQITELYNEKPETDTSNFKTVVYDGTGGSDYISNVGIDLETNGGLIWFKERNGTNHHQLYDNVRGYNYALYSNLTNAQYDYSAHSNGDLAPASVEANGFLTSTVANNGINRSGGDYGLGMAWWRTGK